MTRATTKQQPISVTLDGGELVIRIQTDATPADELLEYPPKGFERAGLDACRASGALKVVRIGRRLYVKRSALVALVDALPAVKPLALPKKAQRGAVYSFSDATRDVTCAGGVEATFTKAAE